MSITTEPARDARLDLRLPRETRELIVEAAALSGASLTDYVLNVVVPTARRDVIESRTISLSKKAWDDFIDILDREDSPGWPRCANIRLNGEHREWRRRTVRHSAMGDMTRSALRVRPGKPWSRR